MANLGLERALAAAGLKLVRTAVGDRYVLEEMLRIGANLGGEQSGHILFLDDATTGDGMLTAVKIASLVSIAGPLDELVADLKIFPQKIVNVRVRSKPALDSLPEVVSVLRQAEKVLGSSGRVVLRYSGTEPLARVMVEAESEEDVSRWTESLASALLLVDRLRLWNRSFEVSSCPVAYLPNYIEELVLAFRNWIFRVPNCLLPEAVS